MAVETGQYIQDGSVTWIVTDVRNSTLVGSITMYAGNTTPAGYLLCDGSAISRTDYKTLFDVIGTIYGEGDGNSTFNLPLLTDNRFVEFAATAGTAKDAGLPNHQHQMVRSRTVVEWSGSANYSSYTHAGGTQDAPYPTNTSKLETLGVYQDGSTGAAIYKSIDTVQPKSISILPIVRYI